MKKNIKFILFIVFTVTFMSGSFFAQSAVTPSSFLYMTWETINNTDIYYQGKILASKDGVIKFSVQPLIYSSGAYLNPNALNYRWYVNDELQKEGKNINFFRYRVPSYQVEKNYVIKVAVFQSNNELGSKIINVAIANPKVVLRPEDSSLRIINNTIMANNSEIRIKAIPYFFNYDNPLELKSTWFINGEKQNNGDADQLSLSFLFSGTGNLIKIINQIVNNNNIFIKGVGEINIQVMNL
jgi:hypothetical protein